MCGGVIGFIPPSLPAVGGGRKEPGPSVVRQFVVQAARLHRFLVQAGRLHHDAEAN
jgi:hypothetical protein